MLPETSQSHAIIGDALRGKSKPFLSLSLGRILLCPAVPLVDGINVKQTNWRFHQDRPVRIPMVHMFLFLCNSSYKTSVKRGADLWGFMLSVSSRVEMCDACCSVTILQDLLNNASCVTTLRYAEAATWL